MSDERPQWRRLYDEIEKTVAPPLTDLVRSSGFLRSVGQAAQLRRAARRTAGRVTSRAWHLLNLPAGSDVHRLAGQLGELDREVRRLTLKLEHEQPRPRMDGADGPG